MDSNSATAITEKRATIRAWGICVLMLLATMLNYMDRLALSQQAPLISSKLGLSNEDYGRIESRFGLAFAIGGIVTGLIADRLSPRWLYPIVLFGWSAAGFATGWVTNYTQLLYCRILLGFFEAGQWPCALVTVQRLLSRRDRPLGNSILQSGASMGAIATPAIVLLLGRFAPGDWRLPFRAIGAIGVFWVIGWLATIRASDLCLSDSSLPDLAPEDHPPGSDDVLSRRTSTRNTFIRRFLVLGVVVIVLNVCWQYFRAWMPKMLYDQHHYDSDTIQYFSIAYYVAADIGCLLVGFWVKWLVGRGLSVHRARMTTFFVCSLLTAMSMVAAVLPTSWWLLGTLLIIGFGSLGVFPTYYAFTQELSARRMGNVTGVLSFLTWMFHAIVQQPIGYWIDQRKSYSQVTFVAGLTPMIGFLAVLLFWNAPKRPRPGDEPD